MREEPEGSTTDLRWKFAEAQFDTGKLKALGWRPATSLAEGFRRTVRSFEPA